MNVEKYVAEDKEIAIEGKLTNRSWNEKDGKNQYMTKIYCNELLLLGGK